MEKAMLAGLLHDCAKCIPNDQKIEMCEKNHILINPVEYKSPYLLHAKLGAFLAETMEPMTAVNFYVGTDIEAICYHTTGEPDMSLLDKIIYIADYIEPGRDKAENLPYIRKIAFEDLDVCMAEILHDTLAYLSSRGGSIDATTKMTYDFYRQYRKKHD